MTHISTIQSGIYHGSCLKLISELPYRSVDALITDPPYGVGFESRRAVTGVGKTWVEPVENDDDLEKAVALFCDMMIEVEPKLKLNADVYVFTRWDIVDTWIDVIRSTDWLDYKMLLVWDKGIPGMGDIDNNWGCGHELILYCKRVHRRPVAWRRSGIIAVDKVHSTRAIHPTEKPVPLLEKFVDMSTKRGEVVLDPFSGSGSAVVAAKNLERIGIGFELKESHYRRSLQRLEQGVLF